MSIVTLTNLGDVQHFKRDHKLAVIVFGCFADPQQKNYMLAVNQVRELLAEQAGAAFAAIDVDEVEQDIATPYKIKAMPTTLWFREGRETGRVENCDVDGLRKTMASHMPLSPEDLEKAVVKKYAETDAAKLSREEEFVVTTAWFGCLDSGKGADVTDTVREVMRAKGTVKADKEELKLGDVSFEGKLSLRVEIERFGVGKVFKFEEGKSLNKSQCGFCFSGHANQDDPGFSDGRKSSRIDADDDPLGAVSGAADLIASLPPSCGG